MKKLLKFVALPILLVGGIVIAASEASQVDRYSSSRAAWHIAGLYVGPQSSRVTTDNANKVAHTGGTRIDFAFAALGNDGGTMSCEWAHIVGVIEGAKMGDPCFVGIGAGNTNPISNANNQQVDLFHCQVVDAGSSDGVVKLRHCGPQSRAALEDAGYQVRTISNGL